jgi:hypothetical protein
MSAAHAADRLDAAVKLLLEGNSPHTVVADIAARYGCGKRQGRNVVAKAYQQIQARCCRCRTGSQGAGSSDRALPTGRYGAGVSEQPDRQRYRHCQGAAGVAGPGCGEMNDLAEAFDKLDRLLAAAQEAGPSIALLLELGRQQGIGRQVLHRQLQLNETVARWALKLSTDTTADRSSAELVDVGALLIDWARQ